MANFETMLNRTFPDTSVAPVMEEEIDLFEERLAQKAHTKARRKKTNLIGKKREALLRQMGYIEEVIPVPGKLAAHQVDYIFKGYWWNDQGFQRIRTVKAEQSAKDAIREYNVYDEYAEN